MMYNIPVTWQMYGVVCVEANSLREAIATATDPDFPLPSGYYVDDSLDLDFEGLDLLNDPIYEEEVAP